MSRYVDAEEIRRMLARGANDKENPSALRDGLAVASIMIDYMARDFDEVQKVKYGEWADTESINSPTLGEWQSAMCTACGTYHVTPYVHYFRHYAYCPNCGAKMAKPE